MVVNVYEIFVEGSSPTRGIDLSFIRKLWQNKNITASSEIRTHDLMISSSSGLPKVISLAVAEGEGKGGKTSALEVEAKGEAKGLVYCI